MQRVVITGASGFLGRYMLETAPASNQILAIFNQKSILPRSNTRNLSLDLTSDSLQPIADFEPEVIYHLAAMSSPEACEQSPDLAAVITVESTRRLSVLAKNIDCRLIFTSTDLVFDGENAPYDESVQPRPINVYGEQKAAAETVVLDELGRRGVVVRCPLMYGRSVHGRENFTVGIIRKLKSSEPIHLFTDEYRTPAWARDVAELLWEIGNSQEHGILHAGGADRLSRFEMGELICAAMKTDRNLLMRSLRKDVNSAAARPRDVSLKSCRLLVRLPLPGFRERLLQLLAQLDKKLF